MEKNIFNVPLYLEADSKEALFKKMQKNNIINDTMFEYYSIYEQKNGKHVAWFRADLKVHKRIR